MTGRLSASRLVTLTGPGGTGTTRLAVKVAGDLADHFADGVWFIDLASLTEPFLVPLQVSTTLGVREESAVPVQEAVTEHLRAKHLLLVLDNCEHLLAACAELVHLLLQGCPEVRVLATSREPLGLAGEAVI